MAEERGLEGIVSKRRDAPYRSGECRDWRKVKTLVWREVNRRGTDITAYLENGGTLEKARQMAAHTSTRTTQLYDRREDRVTLDEVVKINIRG